MVLRLRHNRSIVRYILFNKPFKAFFERQMSKEKPNPLLGMKKIKKTSFDEMGRTLFIHSHIFLYSIYSKQV